MHISAEIAIHKAKHIYPVVTARSYSNVTAIGVKLL